MPKVFSVSPESKEFNVQPLLRQREREIARNGCTLIEIPPKYIQEQPPLSPDLLPVQELIEAEIKAQAELVHGLSIRIYHNTQLAHVTSKSEEFVFLACITMRKVKAIQQEYIEALYIMKALEAFREHLSYGLVKAKTSSRDIATIKAVHDKTKTPAAARRRASSFSDDTLMKQLKKREFFPVLNTSSDGTTTTISYTDTPPFCNHAVALERAKEIASQGYSMIKLPSGYSKLTSHSPQSLSALALAEVARKDQERALQHHVLKLQVAIDIAERFFIAGKELPAAKKMKKVKIVQQEYMHILRLIEAFKAYETSLQFGFLNLDTVEDDLKEIKSVPFNLHHHPSKETDEELVTELMDQKFFPMLFPLLGGGVRIHYSDNPPKGESSSSSSSNSSNSGSSNSSSSSGSTPKSPGRVAPTRIASSRRLSFTSMEVGLHNNEKGGDIPQKNRQPIPYARRLSLRRSG